MSSGTLAALTGSLELEAGHDRARVGAQAREDLTQRRSGLSVSSLFGYSTQGLQCSSFLVMTYFLLREYNILPKKELPSSPWVDQKSQGDVGSLQGLSRP